MSLKFKNETLCALEIIRVIRANRDGGAEDLRISDMTVALLAIQILVEAVNVKCDRSEDVNEVIQWAASTVQK